MIGSDCFASRFFAEILELSPGLVAVARVARVEQVDQSEVDNVGGIIFDPLKVPDLFNCSVYQENSRG